MNKIYNINNKSITNLIHQKKLKKYKKYKKINRGEIYGTNRCARWNSYTFIRWNDIEKVIIELKKIREEISKQLERNNIWKK